MLITADLQLHSTEVGRFHHVFPQKVTMLTPANCRTVWKPCQGIPKHNSHGWSWVALRASQLPA